MQIFNLIDRANKTKQVNSLIYVTNYGNLYM